MIRTSTTADVRFVPIHQGVVSEISAEPVNRGTHQLLWAKASHLGSRARGWFTGLEWRSTVEMDNESNFDRFLDQARQAIAQHGHAVHVCEEAERPTWAYTMGLTTALQCELACFGLPSPAATRFLNECASLLSNGLKMFDFEPISGIAAVPLRLVSTPADGFLRHVGPLLSLGYNPKHFRILQWPDHEGHFPGDPGYKHIIQQLPLDLLPPSTVTN